MILKSVSYEREKRIWYVVILLTVGCDQNLKLNSQPQGFNNSLTAQNPAAMLKSQPQGTRSQPQWAYTIGR